MRFRITDIDGNISEYTAVELATMLTGYATGKQLPGPDDLAMATAIYLERSHVMHETTPFQLIHIGTMLGYYYANLSRNHKVEVINE